MNNPGDFKLPTAEAESFILSHRPGVIVDPAVILRFLPEETATQVVAAYEEYAAKAAELGAQTLQAQAQLHKQVAGIIGKGKR
jgi:hypothetical protein